MQPSHAEQKVYIAEKNGWRGNLTARSNPSIAKTHENLGAVTYQELPWCNKSIARSSCKKEAQACQCQAQAWQCLKAPRSATTRWQNAIAPAHTHTPMRARNSARNNLSYPKRHDIFFVRKVQAPNYMYIYIRTARKPAQRFDHFVFSLGFCFFKTWELPHVCKH